ncbi:Microsomal glutathione S-transferase 1 [Triplophysa tibetana]|uniref:Microsomal glutathione S-transferase 1 n=1 Tax=Triplophysa tibetana TaxID=1572043 RepID=A0A5A9PGI4_9TELE|nr:Microsomal glutathione S-transferase 1 [Triplophysa tibetana]
MAHLINSDVFLAFSTYATIVVLKMIFMSFVTVYYRMSEKAFSNWEDTRRVSKDPEERKKMLQTNPNVERVRRCHQNDLENIIPFVVIGLLYALTSPDLSTALWHFRVFVGSRFIHTLTYVMAIPQPSRALSWMVGLLTTFSMAYRVLTTALFL